MNRSERVIYTADAVYNGVGLPLADAGVLVSSADTIVAFGKLEGLQMQFPDVAVQHLGTAILPAPVNAHTHLDLSRVPFKAMPYYRWIPDHIVANRVLRGLEGARIGLGALRSSDIGAFGDIVNSAEVMEFLLRESDLAGVAHWEIFKPNPLDAQITHDETVQHLRDWRKLEGAVRLGLSLHAPFSVSSGLLKSLSSVAKLEGLPLQIHVAEHPSELELFRSGTGPLAESWLSAGMPPLEVTIGRQPDPDLTPVKYLAELGVLDAKPTLIHMVGVTEEDVRIVAQFGCSVVTCPRSNRNLECGVFPWQLYAKYGVEVGLGTDSVASGETLDIRDEVRSALEVHPALGLSTVLRWAVRGGYKALGMKTPIVARGDDFSKLTVWK